MKRVIVSLLAISTVGVAAIAQHEGRENRAYRDIAGVWTICHGHTGREAYPGNVQTNVQCDALLREDLKTAERAVKRNVKVTLNQGQYDALVSWTFNFGEGNLRSSTLLRKLNAGDCQGARAEFPKWNKARTGTCGRALCPVRGLTKRRLAEQAMFVCEAV